VGLDTAKAGLVQGVRQAASWGSGWGDGEAGDAGQ
jgi:hypothetical protein